VDKTKLLVTKAKNNDVLAFEELVHIYQNKVYALCFKLSGNSSDAQDLAQEAFISAYRSLGNFRNEADFGTWLHRIAVNTWLNLNRKNKGTNIVYLDEPYQWNENDALQREVPAEDGDPLRSLEEKEFRTLVQSVLLGLTKDHRAVIMLRDVEGYSYEEVSRMLGCSLGTVKSRINRAREVMRQRLIELAREAGVALPMRKERR